VLIYESRSERSHVRQLFTSKIKNHQSTINNQQSSINNHQSTIIKPTPPK